MDKNDYIFEILICNEQVRSGSGTYQAGWGNTLMDMQSNTLRGDGTSTLGGSVSHPTRQSATDARECQTVGGSSRSASSTASVAESVVVSGRSSTGVAVAESGTMSGGRTAQPSTGVTHVQPPQTSVIRGDRVLPPIQCQSYAVGAGPAQGPVVAIMPSNFVAATGSSQMRPVMAVEGAIGCPSTSVPVSSCSMSLASGQTYGRTSATGLFTIFVILSKVNFTLDWCIVRLFAKNFRLFKIGSFFFQFS